MIAYTNTVLIDYDGKSLSLNGWVSETGVARTTLLSRLRKNWSLDKVFSKQKFSNGFQSMAVYNGMSKSANAWAEYFGVCNTSISKWLKLYNNDLALIVKIKKLRKLNKKKIDQLVNGIYVDTDSIIPELGEPSRRGIWSIDSILKGLNVIDLEAAVMSSESIRNIEIDLKIEEAIPYTFPSIDQVVLEQFNRTKMLIKQLKKFLKMLKNTKADNDYIQQQGHIVQIKNKRNRD